MTLDITGTDVNYAARAVKVSKIYGEGDAAVRALDSVTVGFPSGRFTAIMGPSGSGKSTLMHCLAGLDTVTSGSVYLGPTDLSSLDDKALTHLRRDQVGFIFQAYNLLPTLTALENITLPLDLAGRKPEQAWLDQVIDTVGLRPRLTHRPTELSGGQQQRVAVARALATRPKIVFADEPTGNLDSRAGPGAGRRARRRAQGARSGRGPGLRLGPGGHHRQGRQGRRRAGPQLRRLGRGPRLAVALLHQAGPGPQGRKRGRHRRRHGQAG